MKQNILINKEVERLNQLNIEVSNRARIYDGPMIITDTGVIFPLDFDQEEEEDYNDQPPPLLYAPVDENFDWGTITPSNNPPADDDVDWDDILPPIIPPLEEEISWDYVLEQAENVTTPDDWSPTQEEDPIVNPGGNNQTEEEIYEEWLRTEEEN